MKCFSVGNIVKLNSICPLGSIFSVLTPAHERNPVKNSTLCEFKNIVFQRKQTFLNEPTGQGITAMVHTPQSQQSDKWQTFVIPFAPCYAIPCPGQFLYWRCSLFTTKLHLLNGTRLASHSVKLPFGLSRVSRDFPKGKRTES